MKTLPPKAAVACVFALMAMILLTGMATPSPAGQAKKPITKKGLLDAIKLNGLSTEELAQQIRSRGVSFRLGSQDEQELRNAGAAPQVIDAVRDSYRPETSGPASNPDTHHAPSNVPPGPPLSRNEIVTMLQGGLPSDRVEQFVEVRGVTFAMNPETAKAITAAGGSRSLLGAISEKASGGNTSHTSGPVQPAATGPTYEELTDQATASLSSGNWAGGVGFLQRAIILDPKQPAAYSLLGYAQLYGLGNINSAQQSMLAAIQLGGRAVVRVYHDHSGSFSSFCQGSFFISKTGMTFKADDGKDTFEASKEDAKEVKLNGVVGAQYGAFHIKVVQAGKTKNYNFAPLSRKKEEANLIINLFQATS